MRSIGGLSFRHVDLEGALPGFYCFDHVHLSNIGCHILNLDFQSCVELSVPTGGVPNSFWIKRAWHVG